MSHHISTRFVGAFAKIHITQGKYFLPKTPKMLWEKEYSFCYPAPPPAIRAKSFIPTRQVFKTSLFLFKIVG